MLIGLRVFVARMPPGGIAGQRHLDAQILTPVTTNTILALRNAVEGVRRDLDRLYGAFPAQRHLELDRSHLGARQVAGARAPPAIGGEALSSS